MIRLKIVTLAIPALLLLNACADFSQARLDVRESNFEDALEQFETLSDKGFEQADYELAKLYASGQLGEDQKWLAMEYYERAYQSGRGSATFPLAKALLEFSDNDDDKRRAALLVQEAAAQNVPGASYALANLLLEGEWIEQDIAGAVAIYTELAFPEPVASEAEAWGTQGTRDTGQQQEPIVHAPAAEKLGKLYRDGILIGQDLLKAQQCLEIAWANGLQRAGIPYARLLEQRAGIGQPQLSGSLETEAPAEQGILQPDGAELDAEAMLDLAETILRELSDRGVLLASYRLALLLDRRHDQLPQEAAELYDLSVQAGFTDSKLRLADIYRRGEGVEADPDKAIAIYHELSDEGNGNATARLGDIYRDGEHRPVNYETALGFYQQSLEQGFERAELRIAQLLAEGLGIEKDIPTAYSIYEKYALQGEASAAFQISKLIDDADQDSVYPEQAWPWLEQAANAGFVPARLKRAELFINPETQWFEPGKGIEELAEISALDEVEYPKAPYLLGIIYKESELAENDEIMARDYLEQAVALEYDPAKLKLADLYANGSDAVKDFERAQEILRDYMAKGDAEATYKLARLIEQQSGEGAITPQLVELYRTSAELGYPPAQIRFADLLLDGNGVDQNQRHALDTYIKLSKKQVGAATFRLGKLHEFGVLREQDDEVALAYYHQAIEEGYELGNLKVAQFLYQGRGGETNYAKAKHLLLKLVNEKNAKAAFMLAEMHRSLRFKVSSNWFQEAVHWYGVAAEMGYLEALYVHATFIEELLKKTSPQGTLLFFQAAQKGHGKAMLQYGVRRFYGEFVAPDQTDGLAWVVSASRLQTEGALGALMTMVDETAQLENVDIAWQQSTELLARLFLDTKQD